MNNNGLGLGLYFRAFDLASPTMIRLTNSFGALEEKADRASRGVKSAYERMGEGLGALTAGAAIVGGMGLVGFMAFRTAAQFEQYNIAFETLLGSQERAAEFLAELRQFAQVTPFDLEGLVEGSKLLLAYGFELERILPMLQTIGDATAALGAGEEGIQRMIRALGQMQAKGRVMTEELLQLQELGLPVFQILQEELGLTAEQVGNIGQHSVAAAEAIDAILRGIDKRFGGLMEKQARSALGIISNIDDALLSMRLRVGEEFLEAAKGILQDVKDTVDVLDETGALRGLGQGFSQLFAVVRPIAGAILGIVRRMGDLFAERPELLATITTFAGLAGSIMLVVGAIGFLRGGALAADLALKRIGLEGVTSIGGLVGPISAVTAAIFLLTLAYQHNWMGLQELVDKARLVWQGFVALVTSARVDPRGFIGNLPEELRDALDDAGLLDFTLQLFQAFTRLRAFAIGTIEGIRMGLSYLRAFFEPILAAVAVLVGWFARIAGWLGIIAITRPSSSGWREYGRIVGSIVAVFATLGASLVTLVKVWGVMTSIASAMKAGVLLLANPVWLVFAAVIALSTAIYWLAQNWDLVKEKVAGFLAPLTGAVSWLWEIGAALVQGALNLGREFLSALIEGLREAGRTVLQSLGPVGQVIAGWLGLEEEADPAAVGAGSPAAPEFVPVAAVPGGGAVPIDWAAASAAQSQVMVGGAAAREVPAPVAVASPAEAEREPIRQPIQLVVDGRILAETVAEIEDEDRRRAVRW